MRTLVLDIEGTLISNAVSIIPRNGLFEFLDFVYTKFERIVVMTALRESKFREIAGILCQEGYAPVWFVNLEWIPWNEQVDGGEVNQYKNLKLVQDEISEVYIIDDMEIYIEPSQKSQWIPIKSLKSPYKR